MKKTIVVIAFILLGLVRLHAQESPTAAGGESAGNGGTSSYSIGQTFYTTDSGTSGSVSQGVQQSYEISIATGIDKTTINLEMSVYPNPAINYLTLKIKDDFTNLAFQLYDLQGKVIESNTVTRQTTTIQMKSLPNTTYFLRVAENKKTVKTFKILKK